MRILDLGCGTGEDLTCWGVTAADEVTGVDCNANVLGLAKKRFPERAYLQGIGECLPFAAESFDCVVSNVALPYMNIPRALGEIHRILVPAGSLLLTLHHPSFTVSELLDNAIPKPVPTLFRLYVAANGLFFHCTGRTVAFLNARTESFQTRRGMTLALGRAGFVGLSFNSQPGPAGVRFFVQAKKPRAQPFVASRSPESGSRSLAPEDHWRMGTARGSGLA